jgi:hypothetical protein
MDAALQIGLVLRENADLAPGDASAQPQEGDDA